MRGGAARDGAASQASAGDIKSSTCTPGLYSQLARLTSAVVPAILSPVVFWFETPLCRILVKLPQLPTAVGLLPLAALLPSAVGLPPLGARLVVRTRLPLSLQPSRTRFKRQCRRPYRGPFRRSRPLPQRAQVGSFTTQRYYLHACFCTDAHV